MPTGNCQLDGAEIKNMQRLINQAKTMDRRLASDKKFTQQECKKEYELIRKDLKQLKMDIKD